MNANLCKKLCTSHSSVCCWDFCVIKIDGSNLYPSVLQLSNIACKIIIISEYKAKNIINGSYVNINGSYVISESFRFRFSSAILYF